MTTTTTDTGERWKADVAKYIDALAADVRAKAAEIERLRAKLDQPCGSCHPCTNYSDETWREAGRKPPHVHEWDEAREDLAKIRELAYMGGQDPETIRRGILGVFESRSH